jgi:hypothetical protein
MIHFCGMAQPNLNAKDAFVYPNNVDFHIMYSHIYFYNLNGKPVNFPGVSFAIVNGFDKKFSLHLVLNWYFHKTYDGQIGLSSMYDTVTPQLKLMDTKLKGGGFSMDFNIVTHFGHLYYESISEDFTIRPLIGFSLWMHNVSYTDGDVNYDRLTYYASRDQGLNIGTINLGLFIRKRIANFPVCFTISDNLLMAQNSNTYYELKRKYSSQLHIGIGLTFPAVKGMGISNIKSIHYTN